MKFLFLALLLVSTSAFAKISKYETICKNNDCFQNGWITTAPGYKLDTQCKNNDCSRYGWFSIANDQSTYDVTCREGSCFGEGWHSTQKIKNKTLTDDVTCRSSDCLSYGWSVRTGYDLMGGNVMCNLMDCSKYGGSSLWRGRPAYTACYKKDCYHEGWDLFIY